MGFRGKVLNLGAKQDKSFSSLYRVVTVSLSQFLYYVTIYLFVFCLLCAQMQKPEDSLLELVLSFPQVDSRDQTQGIRLGSKPL